MQNDLVFTLYKLANTTRTVRLLRLPSMNRQMQLTVDGESITVEPLSHPGSRVLFQVKPNLLTAGDIGALLAIAAVAGGLIWGGIWSYNAEIGTKPNADVMAAVRSAGLTDAQVSDSEATSFKWGSGCDKSDSRRYIVRQNGSQVAIVCQGSAIKLFGYKTKAPTLRFRSGG